MNKRQDVNRILTRFQNQIQQVLVDLDLRYLGCRRSDVEFSLVFNECYILMENIRSVLKTPKETTQYLGSSIVEMESDIVNALETLVKELSKFTDKWGTTYNSWLSSYKSQAKNRPLFNDGTCENYLTYQCNFPRLETMHSDFIAMQKSIDTAKTRLMFLNGKFNSMNSGVSTLLTFATSGIIFYLTNFFKIRNLLK